MATLIGPGGFHCRCGGLYGHEPGCSEVRKNEERERRRDRALGKALIDAIKSKNALAVGRLLRAAAPRGEREQQ